MSPLRSGLTRLLTDERHLIQGRKVGLVVNPTAVDESYRHLVDLLMEAEDVKVIRLFGPEHGVWGAAQDMEHVTGEVDTHSQIPVVSLYGHSELTLRPRPEHLEGLDTLIYDIQDIGSRYYTFVYTLAFCMEEAARHGLRVVVCDRPNPLTGHHVEGGVLDMGWRSFVGRYPLPVRHGLTTGELALFFRDFHGLDDLDLRVVRVEGWRRSAWFDSTGLPWINPSPNMPTLDTALVYPGMCLVEGTNLSEGRGTTRPFEWLGAPWVDPWALAEALTAENLPGVVWRPLWFKPTFQKHAHKLCGGVQPHITNRSRFPALLAGVALLKHCKRLFPEFDWRTEPYEFVSDRLAIDLLGGGPELRQQIEEGWDLAAFTQSWEPSRASFEGERRRWLLYPD